MEIVTKNNHMVIIKERTIDIAHTWVFVEHFPGSAEHVLPPDQRTSLSQDTLHLAESGVLREEGSHTRSVS